MDALHTCLDAYPVAAWIVLLFSFAVLAKCADLFVESAVALANRFGIPKLVIGIVLVSFATTAPELAVSLLAALQGNPEMALGNAIGSVICDDGLALALAALFATAPIAVLPGVLASSGLFLLLIQGVAFFFVARDATLSRGEGTLLVFFFLLYLVFLYRQHRADKLQAPLETEAPEKIQSLSLGRMLLLFLLGLAGILIASHGVVASATAIAFDLGIPEAVIALTLVALGTSIPEVATCIVAARKGHGEVAVGNIIGADILNICWVAGISSLANDLAVGQRQIYFMFPAMFVIVITMLLLLRHRYRLTRWKGAVLFALYLVYLVLSFTLFPPGTASAAATPSALPPAITAETGPPLPPE